jgi:hypothetical protein
LSVAELRRIEQRDAVATSFAFISAGRLFVVEPGVAPREVECQFAREMEERQSKARRRHGWKGESDDAVSGLPGAAVWGKQALANAQPLRVECSAVARGANAGELTFALQVGELGGLFDRALADGTERRLMHRARLRVEEMDRHPATGALVYAEVADGGTIHLALKQPQDNSGRDVTEGDAFDQAPSWAGGAEEKVVYQSAGLARNKFGAVVAVAPFVLHELDLRTGEVSTLLEDADHDLLLPHKLTDGALLFIQRPYEGRQRMHYGRTFLDVLLLPVRLLETAFHFFNYMSVIFSGKPLAKAGEARAAQPDLKKLVLWGRAVEAEKLARKAKQDEPRELVPDTWRLIRREPDGSERVLGKAALGYDLAPDGTVIFTDGKAIHRCTPDGKTEKLLEHFPIEKIVALG